MRDLITALSTVDGGATEALRVIEQFDTMTDQRASALSLLRAAADMAGCAVGLEDPERGLRLGVDADGRAGPSAVGRPDTAMVARFEEITVWFDRHGRPRPLDALILERFARSLHAVKKSRDGSPAASTMRIALDPQEKEANRVAALHRLGASETVAVVATYPGDVRLAAPGLIDDRCQIHLIAADDVDGLIPHDVAAGIHTCAAVDVCHEWIRARTALRIAIDLATGNPTHVRYDELGSIATVVEGVDAHAAAASPDVQLVMEMQRKRPWVIPTLESVLNHSSIRESARLQHLHHSTVRQRLDWLERQLGYELRGGDGYVRASVTMTLWRIAMAAGRVPTPGVAELHLVGTS